MARRKPSAAIRTARLARPLRWLLLALAGAIAGMMLGELVAGGRIESRDEMVRENSGYAGFSANPDAMVADAAAAPVCRDCADSYGAAARLRARRAERADAALREAEPIDREAAQPSPEPADDYRHGEGFPDVEPAAPVPPAPEDFAPGDDAPPD